MDWVVIENVAGYDGRYRLDLENETLTTREWGWIKRHSGYLPLTIEDGLGDPELVTVLAVIALRRAGRLSAAQFDGVLDRLVDLPFDGAAITLETDRQEEQEEPDPTRESSSGSNGSSGPGSPPSSETSPPAPSSSGIPASAISVFGPATSER